MMRGWRDEVLEATLIILAATLCLVTGANDGSAIVAMSARTGPELLLPGLLTLTTAVVVVPLWTTAVAETYTERLFDTQSSSGSLTAAAGVTAAIVVVGVLVLRGQPTSLTLALLGALGGAGFGAGTQVAWGLLAVVLLIAAAAPLLAATIASGITVLTRRITVQSPLRSRLRMAHHVSVTAQAIAYAVNDGQKMLAVALIALPIGVGRPPLMVLLGIGLLFLLGSITGLRSVGATLGSSVLLVRPVGAVVTEASSATAVLTSSLLAAPVSMTQSVAGAVFGTNVLSSYRGVRLGVALRLLRAWAVTLPASFALAALFSSVLIGRL